MLGAQAVRALIETGGHFFTIRPVWAGCLMRILFVVRVQARLNAIDRSPPLGVLRHAANALCPPTAPLISKKKHGFH